MSQSIPSAARLILLLIERIDATVARVGLAGFEADEDAQDAVAFRLLHIGEAMRALKPSGEIDPTSIEHAIAMRHRLAHDYLGVDPEIVWNTALNSLPPLARVCRVMLAQAGERP